MDTQEINNKLKALLKQKKLCQISIFDTPAVLEEKQKTLNSVIKNILYLRHLKRKIRHYEKEKQSKLAENQANSDQSVRVDIINTNRDSIADIRQKTKSKKR